MLPKDDVKEYRRRQASARREKNPIDYIFNQARYRAKQLKLDFTIDKNNIFIPTHCPILGIELKFNPNKRQSNSYSLDRVDSTKGYINGNVRVISWKANRVKLDLTLQEAENLVSYIKGEI